MAQKKAEPAIMIDDLTLPPFRPHEWPRSYEGRAVQGNVQAIIIVRRYSDPQYPGAYILDARTDRINPLALGTIGHKQEELAKALLPGLREQVEAALVAAGWVKQWQSPRGDDLWRYGREQKSKEVVTPAYKRTVSSRLITFTCAVCGETITRQQFPSHLPRYCDKEACRREAIRQRVKKSRQRKKLAQ